MIEFKKHPKRKKDYDIMRVPRVFKKEAERIAQKRRFNSTCEFLRTDGTRVLQNADHLTDLIFGGKKKRKK